ncbi:MAG: hypothetical protein PVI26_00855 [Chitinispirillia bacterium]|jgi:hypothetical protein
MRSNINGNTARLFLVIVSILFEAFSEQVIIEPSEIIALEESNKNRETSKHSLKDSVHEKSNVIVVKETKDTVYVLSKCSIDTLKNNIKIKIEGWNYKGFGFSGGFSNGLFIIRMTPVEEYIKTYKILHPSFLINKLDIKKISYEAFLLSGGMFYVGIGNGLRLGGYGVKGGKYFHDILLNTDSSKINVQVGFGGLLIEKAVYKKKWNGKAGGIIGGGNMTITHGKNVFIEPAIKNVASFFCLEIHGGISYSFFSLFHLGLDISIPAFFMHQGFPSYTNDFYIVNGGLVLKIIIGNLG